ncbi:MAG: hypothetical protein AAF462_10805 [Thermodesulfobacteriota bacterium]
MSNTGTLVIKKRSYFSTHHLWAAEHFSKLAGDIEDNHDGRPVFNLEHRVYVINSIFSTTAFLEAAINEIFQDAHDGHHGYLENLDKPLLDKLAAIWEVTEQNNKNPFSVLEKYQIALNFAAKDEFDKGQDPYQSANLVIKLRNFLTHYKPMFVGGDQKYRIEDKLRGKFALNKILEETGDPEFPDKMLSKGCTDWSIKSIKSFADEFFERMEIEPNYQRVDMDKLAGKT